MALKRGLAFLRASQLSSGEIPVSTSIGEQPVEEHVPDPSVFPTAVAAQCLAVVLGAADIVDRARLFLRGEMDRNGLWRHWTREHPHVAQLPPDVDDTSASAAALAGAGIALPGTRELLLANRRSDGLFLTWIVPRLRWTGARHMRATLPQLRHAPTLALFFRRTSAKPGDVDAGVNANALAFLGAFEGREKIVPYLIEILRGGREAQCDKWYENRFVIWYFFARAIGAEDGAEILARLSSARPAGALEQALAISARLRCGAPPPQEEIEALLAAQLPSGAWPRGILYHGGRQRLRDGGFAPPHPDTPHWGSEALTTAFTLEALALSAGEARP